MEYRDSVHKTFEIIKKAEKNVLTVLGGVYPSISPDVAKEDDNVDFIVISEGEERLIKLMNAIKNKTDFRGIDGFNIEMKRNSAS